MLFRAVAFLAAAGVSLAAYPSEYPFENESIVAAAPKAATPSWTFDEADEGGYMYTFAYMLEDLEGVFSFGNNGMFAHQYVVRSSMAPINDISMFNCTARGNYLGENSYAGVVNGETICDVGECCSDFFGAATYFNQDEPYEPYYTDFGNVDTDGNCPNLFDEGVYCTIMASYQVLCIEQYVSPTERVVTYPCYDSFWHHYSSCTVYAVTGFYFRPQSEPEGYAADSTADELNALNGIFFTPDKVCRPYSYYYPETAKSASSSSTGASGASGASSASDSSETEASESDSASAAVSLIALSLSVFSLL